MTPALQLPYTFRGPKVFAVPPVRALLAGESFPSMSLLARPLTSFKRLTSLGSSLQSSLPHLWAGVV